MTFIHGNERNIIAECNLLHDKINPPKLIKHLNSNHSPILHQCINKIKGRSKFKNFRIPLDSGCVSTTIMGILVGKLHPKKYSVMQWHTQAGNITTNLKVVVDFTLPELSAMNVILWEFHVENSAKVRYNMILGRYL